MRQVQFVEEEYYHIYNRGVDKRKIFMGDEHKDRYRFLHDLFEFNDEKYAPAFCRRNLDTRCPTVGSADLRKRLVEIICFCLMPNHFHLILKQLKEGGISAFMHKMGQGYAKYFNRKYDRSGALFQGAFQAVHVRTDEQMMHLSRYIHLNPVDIFQPKWKENGINDLKGIRDFLKNYRWSSYLDYIGTKNYPSLINREFIMKSYFKDEKDYEKFVMSGLEEDLSKIQHLLIE
ncbi:MAG: transposase [Patescibacteria group bacterium]|nr:transposase [Patescibacteria group bacterium]